MRLRAALALLPLLAACAPRRVAEPLAGFAPSGSFGETRRVLALEPGITATIVAPARIDRREPVDLVVYALPNGNSTAETIGRSLASGVGWRHDIQHIGAQARALRAGGRGLDQLVVAYVETDRKSWPEWRSRHGYARANPRIAGIVEELRAAIGAPSRLAVTVTGHSGGGSFIIGLLDGAETLPPWIERIAFLDANYSYERRHHAKLAGWLRDDARRRLVVVAYDDRNIMLDGKRVVSDSGGTWRATHRMLDSLAPAFSLASDTIGDFRRHHSAQVEILLHPNPANRILHTEMIGEMNAFMHAMLVGRAGYGVGTSVLHPSRAYGRWVEPR